MPNIKKITMLDMETNFSQGASELIDGIHSEIITESQTVPALRILSRSTNGQPGLIFGLSKQLGHEVVSDNWDINDDDDTITGLFEQELS